MNVASAAQSSSCYCGGQKNESFNVFGHFALQDSEQLLKKGLQSIQLDDGERDTSMFPPLEVTKAVFRSDLVAYFVMSRHTLRSIFPTSCLNAGCSLV